MGGKVSVAVGVLAALAHYDQESWVLMALSIAVTIGSFWSWGIMHNYAFEHAARYRRGFRGRFDDIRPADADSVPNWIAWISLGCFLTSCGLLATGLVAYVVVG